MFNPLKFFGKFIKSNNDKELSRINNLVLKINSLEKDISNLPDKEFPKKTMELIKKISNGEKLSNLLIEGFALVREASKRTIKERHFDVQLIGGVVLNENKIAEMKTGEGKTLTIALAAYLNALKKKEFIL